jgi:hypothetical protein
MATDDWEQVAMFLGYATRSIFGRGDSPDALLALLNRLNHGNPDFTPYVFAPEADKAK